MVSTRIEQAIDELDTDNDGDFDPSCDDIRLAWLAHETASDHASMRGVDEIWPDR
jgi:hypothetical protein